jgi:anti-sigma regulatory factor (Ser/Thr protein kinase)
MPSMGDSRRWILTCFLLGIALPSGLLAYLAFRGIQNDRALVERERRHEFRQVADRVRQSVDRRLAAVEGELGRVLSSPDVLEPDLRADLQRLMDEEPLIDAVVAMDTGGEVRVVTGDAPRLARSLEGAAPSGQPADWLQSFRATRGRELRAGGRGGELEGVLERYRRLADAAPNDASRGEAWTAAARVQRRLGRREAAAGTYRMAGARLGDARVSGGVPLGAVAALERGDVLRELGDAEAAARALVDLHADLLTGRWVLTPGQFDFLVARTRKGLEGILESPGAGEYRDSVVRLTASVAPRRRRAMALLDFEAAAEEMLEAGTVGGGGRGRVVVTVAGRAFHLSLLEHPPASTSSRRWGYLLDLEGLQEEVVLPALRERAGGASWVLRDRDGDTLAVSRTSSAGATPRVDASLGGFPRWSLELSPPSAGLAGDFLSSRRAVYLYAFILLAGILVSGLVLTIRSITRELELVRMKSDFVSTVSHEFRSPLTAIRQIAEMLGTGRVSSEERRRRYHEVLLEQSERLSLLVDDVLDFARMEAGGKALSLEPVDPRKLVEEAVSDARNRAGDGFEIRASLDESLPAVTRLDGDAVKQALDNLIDNAVKYSGNAREVIVGASAENGELALHVRDFGVGLEEGELARVFERFYRGGDELTREVKGTGLGLAIVKQIVEAHDGRVEVESEPGRGSRFIMHFPLGGGR